MNSTNTSTPAIVGTLAILAILTGGGYVLATAQPQGQASGNQQTAQTEIEGREEDDDGATTAATVKNTTATTTSTTPSTSSSTGSYKNGTYTASTSYRVPGGATNDIVVQATITDGKISAVTARDTFSDHESGRYIDAFENNLKSAVVGQSLGGFSASRIGGASLTTYAFDEAIQNIANQAKG